MRRVPYNRVLGIYPDLLDSQSPFRATPLLVFPALLPLCITDAVTMATSMKPYGHLPANASSSIKTFDLCFPDADLKQMLDLLKLTPVAEPIYENSLPDGDRHLGLRRDWLTEAKRTWETEFDW
jgi:hypothetical protein